MLILFQQPLTRFSHLIVESIFCFILLFFGGLTVAVAGEMHFQGEGIRIDLRSDDDKVFKGQFQFDGKNYATTATLENDSKLVGSYKKGLVTSSYTVSEDNGKLLLQINNKEYALHDSSSEATQAQQTPQPTPSTPQPQVPQQTAQTPQQAPQPTQQQAPQQTPSTASIPAGWSTVKTQYGYTAAYPSSWQKAERAELTLLLPSNNRNNEMVILTNYPMPGFSQSTTEQQLARLRTEISSEMNIGTMQLMEQPQTFDAAVGKSTKVQYLFRNSAGEGIVRIFYTVDKQDNILILFGIVNKVGANLNKEAVSQIWQLLRRNNHADQGQTSTNRDPNVVGVWCGENVHSSSVSNSYSSSSFCYTFNADGTYADKSTTLIDVDGSGGGRVNGNVNSIGNHNVTGHWTTRGDTLYLNGSEGVSEITYHYFIHSGNGIPHLRWGTSKPYTYLEKQR